MPKMEAAGSAPHVYALGAQIHEADCQFAILAPPPDKVFVIAIDFEEVFTPDTQIASSNPVQVSADTRKGFGPAKSVLDSFELKGEEGSERIQVKGVLAEIAQRFSTDQSTMALDEEIVLSQLTMIGHKIRVRDRVAIQKDNVISLGSADGLIQYPRFSEVRVWLREQVCGEVLFFRPLPEKCLGIIRRAIIS